MQGKKGASVKGSRKLGRIVWAMPLFVPASVCVCVLTCAGARGLCWQGWGGPGGGEDGFQAKLGRGVERCLLRSPISCASVSHQNSW